MTNPIIERAARALFKNDPQAWEGAVEEGLANGAWRERIDDVRLVLGAIREPSEVMVDAPIEAIASLASAGDADGPAPASEYRDDARDYWQAMIDAALSE